MRGLVALLLIVGMAGYSDDEALLTLEEQPVPDTSVAFSPDGKQLATASADRTVKVWDLASGEQLLSLKGHSEPITRVAFSPDGKRLATGSGDQTVKVWDVSVPEKN